MKKLLILGALALLPTTATAQDAAVASPETTKVLFENEYVRVVRSHYEPGQAEPTHTHPAGVYVMTAGGALTVTGEAGKSDIWSPITGEVEWSDGEGKHTAINSTTAAMEYVLVEVKAARGKTDN